MNVKMQQDFIVTKHTYLCSNIERLYKTIRHVYFSNSSIRSSANIQTSKRMLSLNLVERLGRSTRMCCADESAATAGEPCVEEIFFYRAIDQEIEIVKIMARAMAIAQTRQVDLLTMTQAAVMKMAMV